MKTVLSVPDGVAVRSFTAIVSLILFLTGVRAQSADCVAPPSGLAGWWRGEGDTSDAGGPDDGKAYGNLGYAAGEVGEAFSFDGISGYIAVPASTNTNLGAGPGFTVEFWLKPVGDIAANYAPLVEWNSGSGSVGGHLWLSEPVTVSGTGPGSLFINLIDTAGTYHLLSTAPNLVNTNSFQHVAVTYSKAGGMATIYYNGTVAASQYLGTFTVQTTYGLYFGHRVSYASQNFYRGLVDELSLYDRALTQSEIQAIYNAGGSGKCEAPHIERQPQNQVGYWGKSVTFTVSAYGQPPLSYQWQKGETPLADATNTSLVLTNLLLTDGGTYTVIVTNLLGSVTSNPAILTMNPAGVSIDLHVAITIDGVVGLTYGIQSSTNLSDNNSWQGLVNITLSTPTEVWFDVQPANQPRRFYRVVPGPIPIP